MRNKAKVNEVHLAEMRVTMVSIVKMAVMAVCVLISIAALAIPTVQIKKRSSNIETGLAGAIGYGLLGYIWQYIFYMFAGMLIVRMNFLGNGKLSAVVINLLLTLISTGCTALSLYWGIYLTNQKQLSIYRSAAVGIGFSLGKIGIDLIYSYLYSLYFSYQINAGTYRASEEIRQSILESTIPSLVAGTYKCLLMFVIIFAIALLMGHFYIAGNKKMAWMVVLVVYEIVMLVNLALQSVFGPISATASDVSIMAVFTVFAVLAGLVLHHWFRTGEVEWNPGKIIKKR